MQREIEIAFSEMIGEDSEKGLSGDGGGGALLPLGPVQKQLRAPRPPEELPGPVQRVVVRLRRLPTFTSSNAAAPLLLFAEDTSIMTGETQSILSNKKFFREHEAKK